MLKKFSRLPDWSQRLHAYLLSSIERSTLGAEDPLKFSWDPTQGVNCITFSSGGVQAVTGFDLYAEVASHLEYGSAFGAYKAMLKYFEAHTLEDLLGRYFQERPLTHLQTGDIGLVDCDDIESREAGYHRACGIISGVYIYVVGTNGVDRFPIHDVVTAYAVDSLTIQNGDIV